MKRIIACLAVVLSSTFGGAAYADVNCAESVTNLIVHSNGNIYFQTNLTCSSNWCQLNWSNSNLVNQGYAMLLSAQISGKAIVFDWPNIASCGVQNIIYASPSYMFLSN